jgi:hypothetical protein
VPAERLKLVVENAEALGYLGDRPQRDRPSDLQIRARRRT